MVQPDPTLRTVPVPDAWGDTFTQRSQGLDSLAECVRCGRKVHPARGYALHLVFGGAFALHPSDDALYVDQGDDMGWWAIGSECVSVVPLEYRHRLLAVLGGGS